MASKKTHHHPSAPRDEAEAVDAALDWAEQQCSARGLRLTDRRRRVLELLLRAPRALGAYEILEQLRAEDQGAASPPIAYRALEFLTEHGFAHKIERLSAFVACVHPNEQHSPAFMICRQCHSIEEAHVHADNGGVLAAAQSSGFRVERSTIEVEGICSSCVKSAPA